MPIALRTSFFMNFDDLISYDELYESYLKCRRSVSWKPCVKSFDINAPERIWKMHQQLADGTWKDRKPKPILIMYPKKREWLSIPFRDRIFQRSINDNVLYPVVTKSFIEENSACQIGKGISHARKITNRNLRRMYINHGRDFYVMQIDIHHYYQTMPHDGVKAMFKRVLDDDRIYQHVCSVLDTQNDSDHGFNPGSQMIQIAGIAYLSPVDHYAKEQLHLRNYQRYMDDFLAFHEDKEYLEKCLGDIVGKLRAYGFEVNETKTHVISVKDGFRFLGFDYRLTESGKIVMTIPTEKVRHERRKLRREVILWSKGDLPKQKIYDGLRSWKSTHQGGSTYKVFMRLDQYLSELFKEYANENQKTEKQYQRPRQP